MSHLNLYGVTLQGFELYLTAMFLDHGNMVAHKKYNFNHNTCLNVTMFYS